jgi:AbrB family looped-hinge helix DNA binding protein
MNAVTVSPKFQIVIPKGVRESLNISPGMKLSFVAVGGILHMVPITSIKKMKGALPGIDTKITREADRKL